MPGRLSIKLAGVLAALAFAGAFRIEASKGDPAEPAPVGDAHTQAALASDVAPAGGKTLPQLSAVAGLPALRRQPVRHHRHHRRHVLAQPVATVQPSATPVATPVATPTVTIPTPQPEQTVAPKKKSYVGTSFDSNG